MQDVYALPLQQRLVVHQYHLTCMSVAMIFMGDVLYAACKRWRWQTEGWTRGKLAD